MRKACLWPAEVVLVLKQWVLFWVKMVVSFSWQVRVRLSLAYDEQAQVYH